VRGGSSVKNDSGLPGQLFRAGAMAVCSGEEVGGSWFSSRGQTADSLIGWRATYRWSRGQWLKGLGLSFECGSTSRVAWPEL